MNRIMIINDSKFESMILNDMLSQMGYNVYITDEYSALKQIQSFAPDIVLVNYIMKDIRGDKLIEQIKTKNSEIVCILSSSNKLNELEINKNVIDAFVKTPINRHNMAATIKEAEEMKNKNHEFIISDQKEVLSIKAEMNKWRHKAEGDIVSNNSTTVKDLDYGAQETAPKRQLEKIWKEPTAQADHEKIRFCPFCGHDLGNSDESYVFCPFCGHKL